MYERVVSNMIFYHLRTEHIEFLDFVFFWDTLMDKIVTVVSVKSAVSADSVTSVNFLVVSVIPCFSCLS